MKEGGEGQLWEMRGLTCLARAAAAAARRCRIVLFVYFRTPKIDLAFPLTPNLTLAHPPRSVAPSRADGGSPESGAWDGCEDRAEIQRRTGSARGMSRGEEEGEDGAGGSGQGGGGSARTVPRGTERQREDAETCAHTHTRTHANTHLHTSGYLSDISAKKRKKGNKESGDGVSRRCRRKRRLEK